MPEEFAEWIGYSVDELLNGAAETGSEISQQNRGPEDNGNDSESTGFIGRLLGRQLTSQLALSQRLLLESTSRVLGQVRVLAEELH